MKHIKVGAIGLLMMAAPAIGAVTADAVVPAVSPQVPLEPVPAEKIKYINPANGRMTETYWAALGEAQKRALMPSAEAFVQISQADSTGSFSLLPIGAAVKKGDYKMLFRWQQYRADYCLAANPAAGRIRTGVGLEIEAQIKTLKAGLNIANLGALTAAAERDQVSGTILIRQIGLGNTSPTLGTYLSNFALTREGVTKALEAIAVTKAVLENEKNVLTPHYLSTTEATPGSCSAVRPAAARPVI